MAKLKVLKANQNHYEDMVSIDHSITSTHAHRLQTEHDGQTTTFCFQPVKLPREAHLSYMRDKESLLKSWDQASQIFVGELDDVVVSYVAIDAKTMPGTARVSDLVVMPELRNKGIARTMISVVENWTIENKLERILIEMPMRNYPMVELALQSGYELCGFMDAYFPNGDPALFYQKRLA